MDDEIAEVVREHGWFAANIFDHDPPFMYTIGLMQTCSHPDFVVFGLEPENAYALLSGLIEDIRSGQSHREPGVYTVNLGGDEHRVGMRRVNPTQHPLYLGFGMGFMRRIGRLVGSQWQVSLRCRVRSLGVRASAATGYFAHATRGSRI